MSDNEWKPVAGGRAWWDDETALVCGIEDIGDFVHVMVASGYEGPVDATELTEHPDDARHRRLLEAARAAGKTWAAMRGATKPNLQAEAMREHAAAIKALRAIVAEIDQAEADHA